VLDRANRLTSSAGFASTVRSGRRAGTRTLVLHLGSDHDGVDPRVGFVVSRSVGKAVTRNLVKRRLRSAARERLSALPVSSVLVVRALPAAADASFAALSSDFDAALRRVHAVPAGAR
jgi:ribonuclease P protein component